MNTSNEGGIRQGQGSLRQSHQPARGVPVSQEGPVPRASATLQSWRELPVGQLASQPRQREISEQQLVPQTSVPPVTGGLGGAPP